MVNKICKECGRKYTVIDCRADRTKYCSKHCSQTGIARRPVTWGEKIGAKTRNKKRPDLAEYNRTHIKEGVAHPLWKGEDIGYSPLHRWVSKKIGRPKSCIKCGSVKKLQWANRSRMYKRDLKDWLALCAKCHYQYDIKSQRLAAKKRSKLSKQK